MDQKPVPKSESQSQSRGGRRSSVGDNDILAPRVEREAAPPPIEAPRRPPIAPASPPRFDPPISAIAFMFRSRLQRIHLCRVPYELDINTRPTARVLGAYYKSRRLVRIYTHDTELGRRPIDELFDTFLHEIGHHLEYTEPQSFSGKACLRVPGRMHSRLFWRIFGDLKQHWARLQQRGV